MSKIADGGNGQAWVVARGLCAYTNLDGVAVPLRKRRAFAEMAIARWAPFPDPGFWIEWVGNRAMVWAWSKAHVLQDAKGDRILPEPRRMVPESLHRGEPLEFGEELVQMEAGYEARVWRDGMLSASRWWAEVPTLNVWNEFRRGVGLPPATHLQEPTRPPMLDRPWTSSQFRGLGALVGRQRQLVSAVVIALGTGVVAALLTAALALKVSIWQIDRDIQARAQALNEMIEARDVALQDRAAIEAILKLRPSGGQLELLSEVERLMRGRWSLQEWRMPDEKSIELVASMANADPRAIVTAWEASGRFSDVSAEIGRTKDEVRIKAKVIRRLGNADGR